MAGNDAFRSKPPEHDMAGDNDPYGGTRVAKRRRNMTVGDRTMTARGSKQGSVKVRNYKKK
jgi:hypothetical protein